jgi:Fur family ferric uptake transcriptional regulator
LLTTIYRNLPLLIKAGIIRRTSILDEQDSGAHTYETIWQQEHYDHIVCLECGKRVEFSFPAIEVLQDAVAKEHGFELKSLSIQQTGNWSEVRFNE